VALPPAGWYRDPTARFPHRYWDGRAWTEHVSNAGTTAIDPIAADPAILVPTAGTQASGVPVPTSYVTVTETVGTGGTGGSIGWVMVVLVILAALIVAYALMSGGDDGSPTTTNPVATTAVTPDTTTAPDETSPPETEPPETTAPATTAG
jgi:hypothetical protein